MILHPTGKFHGFRATEEAKAFIKAPKATLSSLARQPYFAVNAFQYTNACRQSQFGGSALSPNAGTKFLTPDQASTRTPDFLAAEISERLSNASAKWKRKMGPPTMAKWQNGATHSLRCQQMGDPSAISFCHSSRFA